MKPVIPVINTAKALITFSSISKYFLNNNIIIPFNITVIPPGKLFLITLITSCTIGIPSFILALEPNHNLVDGKSFLVKIVKKSLPGGLTVMLNGIIILLFKRYFEIDENVINALAVLITGITGFIHLAYVSRPFNYLRGIKWT